MSPPPSFASLDCWKTFRYWLHSHRSLPTTTFDKGCSALQSRALLFSRGLRLGFLTSVGLPTEARTGHRNRRKTREPPWEGGRPLDIVLASLGGVQVSLVTSMPEASIGRSVVLGRFDGCRPFAKHKRPEKSDPKPDVGLISQGEGRQVRNSVRANSQSLPSPSLRRGFPPLFSMAGRHKLVFGWTSSRRRLPAFHVRRDGGLHHQSGEMKRV
ncbi:hypothetical protein PM082_007087 [Marasmius tenuissimus]|nr:hypothetical protein PM082_007087 [Marasmius tenuissimus]